MMLDMITNFKIPFSNLTLCAMGGGGSKDPQLSKSLNALKWVHKNCWNVFDFSYIDLKKISNQKF